MTSGPENIGEKERERSLDRFWNVPSPWELEKPRNSEIEERDGKLRDRDIEGRRSSERKGGREKERKIPESLLSFSMLIRFPDLASQILARFFGPSDLGSVSGS